MEDSFETIASVIKNRRSVKPAKMNGKKIPDERIKEILQLANWAPTHGRTEPWRFIVYSGDKVKEFCQQHADLYKALTPSTKFEQANYDKHLHYGDLASHLAIAIMQRGNSPKIPALEEIAATAAAVQNVLLGATAAGVSSFWSTSGMAHHSAMKDFLRMKKDDVILGMIYLGLSDENAEGKRQTAMNEKIVWK